jgi:hypothetical protein
MKKPTGFFGGSGGINPYDYSNSSELDESKNYY